MSFLHLPFSLFVWPALFILAVFLLGVSVGYSFPLLVAALEAAP
jgi:hypothetical protein